MVPCAIDEVSIGGDVKKSLPATEKAWEFPLTLRRSRCIGTDGDISPKLFPAKRGIQCWGRGVVPEAAHNLNRMYRPRVFDASSLTYGEQY